MNSIKKLLLFILPLALAFVSCEKEANETPVIRAVALDIPKEAGTYTLNYTISGASSSAVAEASVDVDWIYDIAVEPGTVSFSADLNVGYERTANMTLSFKGAADVVVKINQASVFNGVFKIEVSDVTPYSAHVTYTPTGYEGGYIFFVMNKSAVMNYFLSEEGLEELYRGDVEYVKEIAEANGLTLEEALQRLPQIYTAKGGVTEMDYTDLSINTEYIAYCYGLSLDGKRLTDFSMTEFSTAIQETSNIKFQAEFSNITTSTAHIKITPSNETEYYYWTYVSEMDYNTLTLEEILAHTLANIKDYVDQGYPITYFLNKGVSESTAEELWAETNYYIVAWGMDAAGNPTTKPQDVGSFKTEANAIVDDCTFAIDILEVKPEEIKIRVTPSNTETMYYAAFIDEEKCVGYSDYQMAQRVVNMENRRFYYNQYPEGTTWADITNTGVKEIYGNKDLSWNFLPDHLYRIYVFGVDMQGNITTAINRVDQKTAEAIESNLTVDVKLVKSTWNYATFEFTPSNDEEYYLPFLMFTDDKQYYLNADGSLDQESLMYDIEEYYEDEIIYMRMKGKKTMEFYWKSDTDYSLFVCGYAGTNSTDFFEFTFHSPAIPFGKSTADVAVEYHLFDGNTLAAKFPERWDAETYKDACVMLIQCTPNADAEHWYAGVWLPVENYDYGIDHLMALIRQELPANAVDMYQTYCCPWYNNPWSLSYVAEGADGNFGPWHYVEFKPTVADTEEPYDFWTNPHDPENAQVFVMDRNAMSAPKDITFDVFKVDRKKAAAGSAKARIPVRDIE